MPCDAVEAWTSAVQAGISSVVAGAHQRHPTKKRMRTKTKTRRKTRRKWRKWKGAAYHHQRKERRIHTSMRAHRWTVAVLWWSALNEVGERRMREELARVLSGSPHWNRAALWTVLSSVSPPAEGGGVRRTRGWIRTHVRRTPPMRLKRRTQMNTLKLTEKQARWRRWKHPKIHKTKNAQKQ
jgi:hypothetical protein